jgi:tetratricopeptide (TPR) repeat protein
VLALLIAGTLARPAAAELTPQQKQEMHQHYEKATRAFDVGKYAEAIEEYQKAYEIGGDPPMLYNIAQAYRLSDQPSEAVRYYRRYLQRQPNAKNREDVERKIADLEKLIEERKKASVMPPPMPPPPAPVAVPDQPAAASAVVTPPPPSTPREEPHGAYPMRRIIGWSVLGAGVLAGAAAGYEGWTATQKANKVGDQSRANPPQVFDPAVEQNGKTANRWAFIFGGISAALIVGGGLLVVLPGAQTAESKPVAIAGVAPLIGGGVVGAGADFRF